MGSESMINKVWSLLMDREVGIIGIYGTGGVGKTTLLKQIYKKLAISPHDFDIVIWVTVSEDHKVEKIADDMWRRIGVFDWKWVEKSLEEKTEAIQDVLCEKKFVLFLDDMWEVLDLSQLGVPNELNESKVLLTSRFRHVCSAAGAQNLIRVDALDKESAYELFKKMVGEDILSDPKIDHLAFLIARLVCRGLPILLRTVARAMASRTTYAEWKYAFKLVRLHSIRAHPQHNTELISSLLKFCFDSLPSDRVKSCLFYYSLFPEDFTILKNDMIDFWICEQLLGHHDTKEDILNLGYSIVDELIGACLLEEEVNFVKLQDLIRDSGLNNAIRYGAFAHAQFIEVEEYDSLKTIGWISSMTNFFQDLTYVPQDLLTFLLKHNPFIMIKGEFSEFMSALTVLDLSNSGMIEVPRWISELVSLQYLNLSHTWIEYLPVELKMLAKLKCLNLEHDDQLRIIPKQLIYGLSSLQVLKIFRCGFSVEELGDNILSARNMDIDPLICLEHLKVLSITITCASALHKFFSNPKLLSCTQSLSLEVFWGSKSLDISPLVAVKNLLTLEIHQAEALKDFMIHHGSTIHYSELLKEKYFERLREVVVEKCSSLCDLTWIILAPNLTFLRVKNCDHLEEIINIHRSGEILKGGENLEPFAKLEILRLESLPNLKSIYWKALPLQCLKKVEVIDCSLLKKLPLNSDSTDKKDVVIEAKNDWWIDVGWENDAARTTFLPCFKPLFD